MQRKSLLSSSAFPAEPDADKLPKYGNRDLLAEIHAVYWGPISKRTIETWDLPWRIVNRHAVCLVRDFIAEAQRRFDAAPVIRGGRRRTSSQKAA
jgi:hypothetical protein